MDWVTFDLEITIGDSFGGKFGRQGEAMDLLAFGLGTTTATHLGGNGRQWIW